MSACEMCGYNNFPMGALGHLLHFRCKACGWMWHQPLPEVPAPAPAPKATKKARRPRRTPKSWDNCPETD